MHKNKLRLVFAGTPEFAAVQLKAMADAGYLPEAVYTQPDRPAGRGRKLQASFVKEAALSLNLPVEQPLDFKSASSIERLASYKPHLIIVSAYGLILPQRVLDIPQYGCWNVHASILPRWRGAAPIQYAIWHQDPVTGVTLMQMDANMDTGDILATKQIPIAPEDTSQTLHHKLSHLGASILTGHLNDIPGTCARAQKQDDSLASYAPKVKKSQAALDFSLTADALLSQIHAFIPWPICFFETKNILVRVLEAQVTPEHDMSAGPGTVLAVDKSGLVVQTAKDRLTITQLQLPGKKVLPFADFYNANPNFFEKGQVL